MPHYRLVRLVDSISALLLPLAFPAACRSTLPVRIQSVRRKETD